MEFRLQSLGEGIDSATVTNVLVKPGDSVKAGQPVISVETDKAGMEIEAEAAGTVGQVHVKPGDKVPVGGLLLSFSGGDKAAPAAQVQSKSPPPPAAPEPKAAASPPPPPAAPAATGGSSELKLPNLGEGIEGGTVTGVLVKVGDAVKVGQPVVSVETDKAGVEGEAEAEGVVEAIHVKPGDKVSVGGKLLSIKGAGAPGAAASPAPAAPQPAAPAQQPAATPAKRPSENGSLAPTTTAVATKSSAIVAAGPATRRLARKLGVALNEVKGSGRGDRVTLEDVMAFVKTERERNKQGGGAGGAITGSIVNAFALPPLPDFTKFGPVEVKDVATIRQTIAKNLTAGWRTMPMVTQHDLADITDLEAGRKRIVDALPKGSPKITMTVLAVKACVAALKEFPHFNSSYDMNSGKLILKKYFGIGIAVDTERGLVVPVIKDADKKSIRDLAAEVAGMAEKARTNKLTIDEMRGGTFTITNLGGIGGTAFTPLVNYPEVAILGLSRSSLQPVVKDGAIVPRLMMPVSLTYDHRVIDGADGCRFTVRLAQLFGDPMQLLMGT
ncbi:dihydrolipoamide acetyltransferase : Pyruvate dehydrogenase E2 component OS=Melioribacter roseus (strain JCM 17771 / P3M-2) GN=MROS_0858 PE=3 SV=1: Biotin_lipoyl: Biotin_lipoyl: E3_binding: 2-oxoacid_dh [Gemmataceae bacterium]|nr:dihydrolipoamide acetyltransferase : Pyruvate dehydrogenase E2 component OS=Melioribacter roseus (strain JCM 17771 / P3M-2) GN=MROS_0858 PE=3 SV=1: Biotin_lipoyl: Biotin_lipoyl: E3_binding: 2-oxoacid_dh [Gemmataceae bacterium]VTT98669.1 dihydrolipoamide acetyltransferase : Pyruvate dehydrogenase E2 component OS=Melioribacter roseus (strain JCM 17771 / P3M-2) GN=MROS_0858 PE=3 SV=1: Biotin_lipoyl: Biotin_lipoyl: E3_binding: 2-oxoacid_dh [Gemmataceae bacterium]